MRRSWKKRRIGRKPQKYKRRTKKVLTENKEKGEREKRGKHPEGMQTTKLFDQNRHL